mgnify:CR=1 FL=1
MDQEYNVSTVAKSGTVTFNAPWQGGFDLSGIYYVANKALNNIIKNYTGRHLLCVLHRNNL